MSDTNSGAADASAADASGPAALKVCPRNTQHVRYFSTKPFATRTILVRARVVFWEKPLLCIPHQPIPLETTTIVIYFLK